MTTTNYINIESILTRLIAVPRFFYIEEEEVVGEFRSTTTEIASV
jgi:hypothetical protein